MATQCSQEISEMLVYWNISSKPETSPNHQRWGPWNLTGTKMGWFEARKNIHNRSPPIKTLRAVTAPSRKLSPDSALHPFGHHKDSTTQIMQNSCINLVDLGIFLSDTKWADSLTVKENRNRNQSSELLRKP